MFLDSDIGTLMARRGHGGHFAHMDLKSVVLK